MNFSTIKYEYMNGEPVAVNKNGTALRSLYMNGCCYICEQEISDLPQNPEEKYCPKHRV